MDNWSAIYFQQLLTTISRFDEGLHWFRAVRPTPVHYGGIGHNAGGPPFATRSPCTHTRALGVDGTLLESRTRLAPEYVRGVTSFAQPVSTHFVHNQALANLAVFLCAVRPLNPPHVDPVSTLTKGRFLHPPAQTKTMASRAGSRDKEVCPSLPHSSPQIRNCPAVAWVDLENIFPEYTRCWKRGEKCWKTMARECTGLGCNRMTPTPPVCCLFADSLPAPEALYISWSRIRSQLFGSQVLMKNPRDPTTSHARTPAELSQSVRNLLRHIRIDEGNRRNMISQRRNAGHGGVRVRMRASLPVADVNPDF